MGRGLSERQVAILKILGMGRLTTVEVAERVLETGGFGPFETRAEEERLPPHRQRLHTVRRALTSLQRRGLVAGEYTRGIDGAPGETHIMWGLAE